MNIQLVRRFIRQGVWMSLLAMAFLLAPTVASAGQTPQTVEWTGNGASGGTCDQIRLNDSVPAGQQRWLFILTSPNTGPWQLTATFQDSGQKVVSGTKQGNGSVHFTVVTSANDVLQSASATNGTSNSVLTVSSCETAAEVGGESVTRGPADPMVADPGTTG